MLLAVDPGKRVAGWAWFGKDSMLLQCGLARAGDGPLWVCVDEITSAIGELLHGHPHRRELVIEKPQIYEQRKWKARSSDLIDLAIMVGALIREVQANDCQTPHPKDWKGTVPKTKELEDYIIHRRNLKVLQQKERVAYNSGLETGPAGLQHNIVDAVGIGLWALAPRRSE